MCAWDIAVRPRLDRGEVELVFSGEEAADVLRLVVCADSVELLSALLGGALPGVVVHELKGPADGG